MSTLTSIWSRPLDPDDPDGWVRNDLPLTPAERAAQLAALDQLARDLDLSEFLRTLDREAGASS